MPRKPRKLWKVVRGGKVMRPESRSKAYLYVDNEARCLGEHLSSIVRVYVDERDGQGWQLYEKIDLRELPAWTDE